MDRADIPLCTTRAMDLIDHIIGSKPGNLYYILYISQRIHLYVFEYCPLLIGQVHKYQSL